jgi:hypothetical protein
MTNKLNTAFDAAARLPQGEQDALAAAILEEIQSEPRWTATFATHANALEHLADEAPHIDFSPPTRTRSSG